MRAGLPPTMKENKMASLTLILLLLVVLTIITR